MWLMALHPSDQVVPSNQFESIIFLPPPPPRPSPPAFDCVTSEPVWILEPIWFDSFLIDRFYLFIFLLNWWSSHRGPRRNGRDSNSGAKSEGRGAGPVANQWINAAIATVAPSMGRWFVTEVSAPFTPTETQKKMKRREGIGGGGGQRGRRRRVIIYGPLLLSFL